MGDRVDVAVKEPMRNGREIGANALDSSLLEVLRRRNLDAPDIFRLFYDGRAPPYSRIREVAIGREIRDLAKSREIGNRWLSRHSGSDELSIMLIKAGIFRLESLNRGVLGSIAKALGTKIKTFDKIAEDAVQKGIMRVANDPGHALLVKVLSLDLRMNPERYGDSLKLGSGVRFLRIGRYGLDKGMLARRSCVDFSYVELLEYGNVPREELDERLDRIAAALGSAREELMAVGSRLVFQASCGGTVSDYDRIIDNVKVLAHSNSSRRRNYKKA